MRTVCGNEPKCLIPVAGHPVVSYSVGLAVRAGVRKLLIAGGRKSSYVASAVRTRFVEAEVLAVDDDGPGRGNACGLRGALRHTDSEWIFCTNADTILMLSYASFAETLESGDEAVLALTRQIDVPNAGAVKVDPETLRVLCFDEQRKLRRGEHSNCGLYLFRTEVLRKLLQTHGSTSIEHELLPQLVSRGCCRGFDVTGGFFVDVGTPDRLDYARACLGTLLTFEEWGLSLPEDSHSN